MQAYSNDIVSRLRKEILVLQGYKTFSKNHSIDVSLGAIAKAFPDDRIPLAAIHEFICSSPESASATTGFVAALSAPLMKSGGSCIWISSSSRSFAPALSFFGVEPHRIIFLNIPKEKDILWAAEEALKCNGLGVVIIETKELGFTASRRLQLAVEQSQVTGFLLRHQPRILTPNVCTARWEINPLPSELPDKMPGVGFPRWKVDLLKVRNGKPGQFELEWDGKVFHTINMTRAQVKLLHRKTG